MTTPTRQVIEDLFAETGPRNPSWLERLAIAAADWLDEVVPRPVGGPRRGRVRNEVKRFRSAKDDPNRRLGLDGQQLSAPWMQIAQELVRHPALLAARGELSIEMLIGEPGFERLGNILVESEFEGSGMRETAALLRTGRMADSREEALLTRLRDGKWQQYYAGRPTEATQALVDMLVGTPQMAGVFRVRRLISGARVAENAITTPLWGEERHLGRMAVEVCFDLAERYPDSDRTFVCLYEALFVLSTGDVKSAAVALLRGEAGKAFALPQTLFAAAVRSYAVHGQVPGAGKTTVAATSPGPDGLSGGATPPPPGI